MNAHLKASLAFFITFAAVPAFSIGLGNELTDVPKAESTRSRADVIAETREAMKHGSLERSSYDELIGVVTDRQAKQSAQTQAATRALVKAQTRDALAHGGLERSSYDEQISVTTQRQAR